MFKYKSQGLTTMGLTDKLGDDCLWADTYMYQVAAEAQVSGKYEPAEDDCWTAGRADCKHWAKRAFRFKTAGNNGGENGEREERQYFCEHSPVSEEWASSWCVDTSDDHMKDGRGQHDALWFLISCCSGCAVWLVDPAEASLFNNEADGYSF